MTNTFSTTPLKHKESGKSSVATPRFVTPFKKPPKPSVDNSTTTDTSKTQIPPQDSALYSRDFYKEGIRGANNLGQLFDPEYDQTLLGVRQLYAYDWLINHLDQLEMVINSTASKRAELIPSLTDEDKNFMRLVSNNRISEDLVDQYFLRLLTEATISSLGQNPSISIGHVKSLLKDLELPLSVELLGYLYKLTQPLDQQTEDQKQQWIENHQLPVVLNAAMSHISEIHNVEIDSPPVRAPITIISFLYKHLQESCSSYLTDIMVTESYFRAVYDEILSDIGDDTSIQPSILDDSVSSFADESDDLLAPPSVGGSAVIASNLPGSNTQTTAGPITDGDAKPTGVPSPP